MNRIRIINWITFVLFLTTYIYIPGVYFIGMVMHIFRSLRADIAANRLEAFDSAAGDLTLALLNIIAWTIPLIALPMANRLWKRSSSKARKYQYILSSLMLLSFPVGTLLHGYVIYWLLRFNEVRKSNETASL